MVDRQTAKVWVMGLLPEAGQEGEDTSTHHCQASIKKVVPTKAGRVLKVFATAPDKDSLRQRALRDTCASQHDVAASGLDGVFQSVRLLDADERQAQQAVDAATRDRAQKRAATLESLGDTKSTADFLGKTMEVPGTHVLTPCGHHTLLAKVLRKTGASDKRQRRAATASLKIFGRAQSAAMASANVQDDADDSD